MKQLRHRTASSNLSDMWEFDPARRCLEVVMQAGSAAPVALTIEVCAVDRADRAHAGARPMQRLDGESWRVLPVRWLPKMGNTPGHYVDDPIHESLGHSHLILTNAPADVDAELEGL